jgi:hypothetical protein
MAQEPRYTAAESAKRTALLALGVGSIVASRSTGPADRALDRLEARALERERIAAEVKEAARVAKIREREEAKAKRRAENRWW